MDFKDWRQNAARPVSAGESTPTNRYRGQRFSDYIEEQIRAAEELGIDTWVLWNPRSVYQRDSLRPYRDLVTITGGAQ